MPACDRDGLTDAPAGYIDAVAKACTALAAAVKRTFLQSDAPPLSAAAQKAHITAISSIAAALLLVWCDLGAVWAAISLKDVTAEEKNNCSMYRWSEPELQVTIQPFFSLVMTLLRLEAYQTSSAKQGIAPVSKFDSILFSQEEGSDSIWSAVTMASRDLSSLALSIEQTSWQTDALDDATALIKQTVLSPEVQELQLFMLAAVASNVHQQQKDVLPAKPSKAPASGASSSDAQRSRDQSRQREPDQIAADCSAEVLQQLGLAKQQAQQLIKALAADCDSDPSEAQYSELIGSAVIVLGCNSASASLVSGTAASTLALLKVQLMVEMTALMPTTYVLSKALASLFHVSYFITKNCLSYRTDRATRSAVTAAVADSILPPLLLEVLPAVMQNKDGLNVSYWTYVVLYFWTLVHMNNPGMFGNWFA